MVESTFSAFADVLGKTRKKNRKRRTIKKDSADAKFLQFLRSVGGKFSIDDIATAAKKDEKTIQSQTSRVLNAVKDMMEDAGKSADDVKAALAQLTPKGYKVGRRGRQSSEDMGADDILALVGGAENVLSDDMLALLKQASEENAAAAEDESEEGE
jgi:hypothetical protein